MSCISSSTSPIRRGRLELAESRHASEAVSPAESEAFENWELVNGNLLVNLRGRLSDGDTGALRKTKWSAYKSGAKQLRKEDTQVGSDELLITCYQRYAVSNMPAIKKERLDGEDMALAAFNHPEYLAPLNATAIPVVTPHPPPYDHIFAHHRAYLGLHDTTLHHQSLHHHPDDLMLERFSSIPDFQPFFDNGEPCIEVECGENKALLYINKLCQGSKGPSIKYRGEWLTPNEFQFVSGRETAKDWKRSIRHKGKLDQQIFNRNITCMCTLYTVMAFLTLERLSCYQCLIIWLHWVLSSFGIKGLLSITPTTAHSLLHGVKKRIALDT